MPRRPSQRGCEGRFGYYVSLSGKQNELFLKCRNIFSMSEIVMLGVAHILDKRIEIEKVINENLPRTK